MSLDALIRERGPAWERLRSIVDQVLRRGPRRVAHADLLEMLHLYRDVSADLARLRAYGADPALIEQVNRLVTRAHGQIYRGESRRSHAARTFFVRDYPRLVRETWRFTAASIASTVLFAVLAYGAVQDRPDVIADILGGGEHEFRGEHGAEDIRGRFRQASAAELSSFVTTNNIRVALTAFALGITFGVGTVYILVVNGAMLGGFAGAYARNGAAADFWITILPHGALELSAIMIAGGAGLMVGYALWCPGLRTRRRALREEAARAVKLAIGLVPAFILAGLFEGFVTPSDRMPDALKAGLGVFVAVLFWTWLLVGGRSEPAAPLERKVAV